MKFFGGILLLLLLDHGAASDEIVSKKWAVIGNHLKNVIWPHTQRLVTFLRNNEGDSRISEGCSRSLRLVAQGLETQSDWAFKMMDASSKFAPGFLSSTYVDFGDYDQCLAIEVDKNQVSFSGKYCLYRIHIPLPARSANPHSMPEKYNLTGTKLEGTWFQSVADDYKVFYYETINNAICVPSTCSPQEVEHLFAKVSEGLDMSIKLWSTCDTRQDFEQNFSDYPLYKKIALTTIIALVALVVVSTILTYFTPEGLPHIFKLFSALENTQKLFTENKSQEAKVLGFVSGLRVLYLLLALFIHIAATGILWIPGSHIKHINWSKQNSTLGWFSHGVYATWASGISNNFVLGGFLCFITWYPVIVRTDAKVKLSAFLIIRWLRATPVIVGAILIVLGFPQSWGSGPLFRHGLNWLTDNCLQRGWAELLYVGNQYTGKQACIPHSWYLSADFHLYFLSYFILVLFYRKPRIAMTMLGVSSLLSIIAHGIVVYRNNLSTYLNPHFLDWKLFVDSTPLVYLNTYNHIPAYSTGLMLGYFYLNKTFNRMKKTVHVIGILTNITFVGNIYVAYKFGTDLDSQLQQTIYGALLTPLTGLYLAWSSYGLLTAEGGLKVLFANKLVAPLGRFSYSIFMGSYFFIWFDSFSSRRPVEVRTYSMVLETCYTFVFSVIIGYIIYLLFEAPFINLGKAFYPRKEDTKVTKQSAQINRTS